MPGAKVGKTTKKFKVFILPFKRTDSQGNRTVGNRYLGCALPRGKAFALGESSQYAIPDDSGGFDP